MKSVNWQLKRDRVKAAQRAVKELEQGGEGAVEAAEYMVFSHRIVQEDIVDFTLVGGLQLDEANKLLLSMGEEELDENEFRDLEEYPWEGELLENQ